MSRNFALIGFPLGHTMSPPIHERLFALSGKEGFYGTTEIPPEALESSFPTLDSLRGYNITIPHKVQIIPFLDELDASAALYSSVNCVKNSGGKRIGFNTDGTGFLHAVKEGGASLEGRVLLLGCGGAGRTFAMETVLHKGDLTIAVRPGSEAKAKPVLALLKEKAPDAKVQLTTLDRIEGEFDLLLNSTPVGMFPHTKECPVSDDVISRCKGMFDAVYNPSETILMKKFRAKGKPAIGGMSMLVWQAAAAHEIWDGDKYSSEEISGLILEMEKLMEQRFC